MRRIEQREDLAGLLLKQPGVSAQTATVVAALLQEKRPRSPLVAWWLAGLEGKRQLRRSRLARQCRKLLLGNYAGWLLRTAKRGKSPWHECAIVSVERIAERNVSGYYADKCKSLLDGNHDWNEKQRRSLEAGILPSCVVRHYAAMSLARLFLWWAWDQWRALEGKQPWSGWMEELLRELRDILDQGYEGAP